MNHNGLNLLVKNGGKYRGVIRIPASMTLIRPL